MATTAKKTPLVTPVFRVSYPHVFEPQLNNLNGKQEYSVEAIFKAGTQFDLLKKAVQDAVAEMWGPKAKIQTNAQGNAQLWVDGKLQGKATTIFKLPFKKQDDKEKEGVLPPPYEKGGIYLTLKSTKRPGIVDQHVQPIIDSSDFYPGCWAIANVNAGAYDQKGNQGVTFYLNHLQKVKDGEPLGGRTRPEDAFQPIVAEETANQSADQLF